MLLIRTFSVCILACLVTLPSLAQTVELEGQVIANDDVESIHIINKTSQRFTTTNALGRFVISGKFQDTILVSSVQYKPVEVVLRFTDIQSRKLVIQLEEQVNVLDQVIVGKILTGDLNTDVAASDAERPLAFYDVGLPGYTGKPKTQSERRLHEADGGQWFNGLSFNMFKLMNRVNGRTKMLRERVRKENNDVLLNRIRDELAESFFETHPLEENLRAEFFYFCSEDDEFVKRCANTSQIEALQFLDEKYDEYIQNLKSNED